MCADHIVNQLIRLEAEDRFESESPSLLDKLKRMVRLLASYGVDTTDNALTGEPYWKGLAAQTSQNPFPDESGLTQWVAGIVLNELLVIHSKNPAAFSIRSRHVSLLPHFLAEVQSDKLMIHLVEPEYPEVLGHGVPIMHLPIDIHVRDEQGRTLQQVVEQSRPAEAEGLHARVRSAFLLAHLAELRRQWMEHERPFVRRQLDEQTDMPPRRNCATWSWRSSTDSTTRASAKPTTSSRPPRPERRMEWRTRRTLPMDRPPPMANSSWLDCECALPSALPQRPPLRMRVQTLSTELWPFHLRNSTFLNFVLSWPPFAIAAALFPTLPRARAYVRTHVHMHATRAQMYINLTALVIEIESCRAGWCIDKCATCAFHGKRKTMARAAKGCRKKQRSRACPRAAVIARLPARTPLLAIVVPAATVQPHEKW